MAVGEEEREDAAGKKEEEGMRLGKKKYSEKLILKKYYIHFGNFIMEMLFRKHVLKYISYV